MGQAGADLPDHRGVHLRRHHKILQGGREEDQEDEVEFVSRAK